MGLKFGYLWGMVLNWNMISLVGVNALNTPNLESFVLQ